jgi:hypothetical protein
VKLNALNIYRPCYVSPKNLVELDVVIVLENSWDSLSGDNRGFRG